MRYTQMQAPMGAMPASTLSVLLCAALCNGCANAPASGGSGGGRTAVTVFATSTANSQLSGFSITLQNLTLTSQSGKTVSLLTTPQSDEFIHLNGNVEPLVNVSVPQDVYASATATFGSAYPVCVGQNFTDEALNGPGTQSVKINLPEPITVTGAVMGLALDLQVSASAPFSGGCSSRLTNSVPVAPVFNLTPVTIAAQPTNSANGKAVGVEGLIGSIETGGAGMSVNALNSINAPYPPSWQVSLNSSTVFQGVSGPSQLAAGMAVDMDLVVQADGSLLATRVAAPDTNAASVSVANGPPIQVSPSNQQIYAFEVEQGGDALAEMDNVFGYANATFQVSSQFTNLQNLPFTPTFGAANMVTGQNIFFSTHAQIVNGFPPLPTPVTTMTLMPQTINGTVSAISSAGGFTTYTVTLAAYDLFPILAAQPGPASPLTNPGSVVVYADSNTQTLSNSGTDRGWRFSLLWVGVQRRWDPADGLCANSRRCDPVIDCKVESIGARKHRGRLLSIEDVRHGSGGRIVQARILLPVAAKTQCWPRRLRKSHRRPPDFR